MNTEGLLFLLLRSEFCSDVKEAITVPPSEDDLKALYTLSKMHDVAHIISNALQKRGLLGKDEASQKFSNVRCWQGVVGNGFFQCCVCFLCF